MRFLIILLLLLGACAQAPCPDALFHINNSQYVLKQNDCCDKSVAYCNALLAGGYDANVVVGSVSWSDIPHAWVRVEIDGQHYCVDPVVGPQIKKTWNDRKLRYVFEQGVTANELRQYKRIIR